MISNMISRKNILDICEQELKPHLFKDYAPNGLQIEGTDSIKKIVTAVTASRAAIEFAAQQNAQMLLVHHGLFWKSEPVTITGWKKQRIATLLQHEINLVGYHLPLDAHPVLGNNAQLAQLLNFQHEYSFGEQNLLNMGNLNNWDKSQANLLNLLNKLEDKLQKKPILAGNFNPENHYINQVVWCSGGAQGFFQDAINAGADVFITGEISEPQFHLANETGVVFIAAGHHATERYGVQALGEFLKNQLKQEFNFDLELIYFDENNPA